MCNGTSTRVSQGGSIAVLRPTHHLIRTHSEEDMLLFFSNRFSAPGTSVEFQGLDESILQDIHWVVIHRDGDLTNAPEKVSTNPLYSFSLDARPLRMQLPQRLDLGVGERGIIGRRVSVMVGSFEGPLTLAEGIIGWN
ncbi:oxoglutarate iron-dependent oxygenase protein [Pyrenophora tritici-repentis]|uniref:Uncharacterized protein n=2 Tax=Pyrenophora tritici-repentis TaxID=45151 RepID=A0A2W1H520_9PLEO|nr:uncharacterized protein PTRG_06899 [Pyrenophora tritici-repentis Pt-1C-BFP]KAA8614433.1 hypothetical protein PtrV1_11463 [Pyrenophora tritici-repentis]EDU49819.1 conserved hypothetical protein [Pyrenophora tritici-repentis Pt-1C-BFP]KAF7444271.1 hypothetical protein A1F99_108240 [Pyrenophora tritici-repentis]KAF7565085.1 hypothetical protein PtrM4_045190 [Pyrenophora tritici-repentis]KAG9378524.1 hypothetical protein A1F94_010293 [Pyrenophora tritici-repentis]